MIEISNNFENFRTHTWSTNAIKKRVTVPKKDNAAVKIQESSKNFKEITLENKENQRKLCKKCEKINELPIMNF